MSITTFLLTCVWLLSNSGSTTAYAYEVGPSGGNTEAPNDHDLLLLLLSKLNELAATQAAQGAALAAQGAALAAQGAALAAQGAALAQLSNSFQDFVHNVTINFQLMHDIGAHKAEVLGEATSPDVCAVSGSHATLHSVAYKQKIFSLGVKHHKYQCDNPNMVSYDCPDIDVTIIHECPQTKQVIDINKFVPLRVGDIASTYGYIMDYGTYKSRYWTGSMAGKLGPGYTNECHQDEYIFQGVAQIEGMSGGPTINGCGYTGMVHANTNFVSNKVSTALVIPARFITACADTFLSQLNDISTCPGVQVVDVPRSDSQCVFTP